MDVNGSHRNTSTLAGNDVSWCSSGLAPVHVQGISMSIDIMTVLINLIAIGTISKERELRHSIAGILMINMCVSGVIPAVISGIFSFCMTTELLFISPPACVITAFISNTNSMVTISSIAAMAADRCIAVSLHMRYFQTVTPHRCLVFILFQWSLCLSMMTIPLLEPGVTWCVQRHSGCGFNHSFYSVVAWIVLIYLPSSITILVSYAKIWKVFKALRDREERGNTQHRHTGIRTTVLILVAFVLYTLPVMVYTLLDMKISDYVRSTSAMTTFQDVCTLVMAAGPAINTVIYAGTNLKFKSSVKKCCVRGSNNVMETNGRKVTPGAITVASLTV